MSSQILLYSGAGAGPFCTKALENQLEKLVDKRFHILQKIPSFPEYFSDPDSINAVFVPGGNAVTMLRNTTVNAKTSFKELFTKYHSSYYGACAGGVFAASGVFETFTPKEGDMRCTELESYPSTAIFPGRTVAPLFPKPRDGKLSLTNFHLLNIHLINEVASRTLISAHILSPGYLNVDQIEGAEILSTYDNLNTLRFAPEENGVQGPIINPKILSESLFYQSRNSRMILTGSHPEIDSKAINSQEFKTAFSATKQQQEEIFNQMQKDDSARQSLMKENFEKIGIRCLKIEENN